MKISPIGPAGVTSVYTELFSQPVIRSYSKSQKGRLLVNHLEPKDRVTISPEARMLSILRQQSPIGKPEQASLPGLPITRPGPPIHSPFPEPPSFIPPSGIGLPNIIPSDDFTIPFRGQPPVVAIPEQRDPEPPDPTHEAPKTLPIAPVPPLQNPGQSISRDQIELFVTDGGTHG